MDNGAAALITSRAQFFNEMSRIGLILLQTLLKIPFVGIKFALVSARPHDFRERWCLEIATNRDAI